MPETEIVSAANLGVARRHNHRALLVEHFPELAEVGVVGRAFGDEAVFLLSPSARRASPAPGRHGDALIDLFAQEAVVIDRIIGAAKGAEDRADIVDAAEIGIDRRRLVLGALQDLHKIVLGLRRFAQVFAQPVDVELDADSPAPASE